jgi:monofunctional biosynthetic peptidoglycan transglycosylase
MRRRFLGLLAVVSLGASIWLGFEALVWPDVAILAESPPAKTAFMRLYEERHGRQVRTIWVPYGEIADTMKRAVLVAEDIEFFSHEGFAVEELGKAIREAIEERELPRGASTITQQLAKNLWLSPARTPRRKLREALLTRSLERHLEKRRILEIYLNVVEFGDATFGCEAASRHYFGKPASRLSDGEAARLAAVLPRPSQWSPVGEDGAFLASAERIRRRMRRARWLREVI